MGTASTFTFTSDTETVTRTKLNNLVAALLTEFNGSIENVNIGASAGIVASKLDLSAVAQVMAMSSKEFLHAKGADVASGTSIALGTDGNYFDITGTTTIQTITAKQAGTVVWLQFDGALTLTDDTGNLELNGSDVTVDAEDVICLVSDGTNWDLISHSSPNVQKITEIASAPSTAASEVALYTKDTGGQPELFMREESDGDEVQITSGGALKAAMFLKSTTTWATATTSGDIAIEEGKRYKMYVNSSTAIGTTSGFTMQFDTTAAKHEWTNVSVYESTAAQTIRTGTTVDDAKVRFTDGSHNIGNGKGIRTIIDFETTRDSVQSPDVTIFYAAEFSYYDDSEVTVAGNVNGLFQRDGDPSTVTFGFSASNGTAKLYEIS